MGTALIFIGIGCIIAAIVGGGVKLPTIEVVTFKSLWRQLLLGAFGIALTALGALMEAESVTYDTYSAGETDYPEMDVYSAEDELVDSTDESNISSDADVSTVEDINAIVPEFTEETDKATVSGPLRISNNCPKPVRIWLVYQEEFGWSSSGESHWYFAPNDSSTLQHNGNDIMPITGEIYYIARSMTDDEEWSGNNRFGNLENLRRVDLELNSNGEYDLSLTC